MRIRLTQEFIDENSERVKKLAQIGCTDGEICYIIGVEPGTMRNRFKDPLYEGRNTLRASLRKAQLELAVNEKNPTMLIWLGKNLLGQKEPRHTHEHSGVISIEKVTFGSTAKKDQNT